VPKIDAVHSTRFAVTPEFPSMIHRLVIAIAALVATMTFSSTATLADTLTDIKAKGMLTVGVKADYPPYGFRDTSGRIVGIEPDLAADVAKRVGVALELVPVVASNRMQFLQQGKIDLMIATMAINEDRKKAVGIVAPPYYASGVAILVNKKANVKSAADLKGKAICAIQGSFYNSRIQSEFVGRDLVAFKGVPESELGLLNGECIGFVYDDVLLIYKKQSEAAKWVDFEVVVLTEFQSQPWGVAIKLEEKDSAWAQFISAAIADWLKSGTLLAREKKWLGANTKWLEDATAKAK
jgi:polar amino acid transport system substrate-binding protein